MECINLIQKLQTIHYLIPQFLHMISLFVIKLQTKPTWSLIFFINNTNLVLELQLYMYGPITNYFDVEGPNCYHCLLRCLELCGSSQMFPGFHWLVSESGSRGRRAPRWRVQGGQWRPRTLRYMLFLVSDSVSVSF